MYIVATFEHSNYLELAITAVQMKGLAKENILCVPMDKRSENRRLFDTIHSADGLSLLDLPIILATLFCLFGGIYGFILKWGPILWGLIGIFLGFSLGLIIKLITAKKYNQRQKSLKLAEVVIIIDCNETQIDIVKDTLWEHNALGVSKLSLD
jgi:predicted permease